MNLKIYFFILIICFFLSCGKNKKHQVKLYEDETFVSLYLSTKDLPECSEEENHALVYVFEEKSFYLCEKKQWVKAGEGETSQEGAKDVSES